MGFLDGLVGHLNPFEMLNPMNLVNQVAHLPQALAGGGPHLPGMGNGTTAAGAAPFAGMFDGPLPGFGGLGNVMPPHLPPLQPVPMGPINWNPGGGGAHPQHAQHPHHRHHHHHHQHHRQPDMVFTESEVDPSRARPGVPDMVFTPSEVEQADREARARGGR